MRNCCRRQVLRILPGSWAVVFTRRSERWRMPWVATSPVWRSQKRVPGGTARGLQVGYVACCEEGAQPMPLVLTRHWRIRCMVFRGRSFFGNVPGPQAWLGGASWTAAWVCRSIPFSTAATASSAWSARAASASPTRPRTSTSAPWSPSRNTTPSTSATATRTMSVRPKSDRHKQTFDWGRSNFLQEARTLARFEHPEHRARHARVRGQLHRLHGDALRAGAELRGLAHEPRPAADAGGARLASSRRCSTRCR